MKSLEIIIHKHFVEKQSITELAKEYNICRNIISANFKKIGLEPINYQNSIKFNNTIFDSVDTEEKAYWLGFIAADGYVGKNNEFEIGLSIKDINHLEKFKHFLNHTCDVKTRSNKTCRISFRNKYFVNRLKSIGIVNNKSLILEFPQINNDLIRHFIRGYFDGDGCIHIRKTVKKNPLLISILGTPMFLNKMRNYLPTINKLYKNNHSNDTLVYQTSGVKAMTILNYLYKDSTIFLDRKQELYLAVLNRNV